MSRRVPGALHRLGVTRSARAVRRIGRQSLAVVRRAVHRALPPATGDLDPVLRSLARTALAEAGPATLTAIGLRLRSPDVATVLEELGRAHQRPRWSAGAAEVAAGLGGAADRAKALNLLRDLVRRRGPHVLDERQQLVLAQLLFDHAVDRELIEVLPRLARLDATDVAVLETDLLNPVRGGDLADANEWSRRFGETWEAAGLSRPAADPTADGHLFDTLHTDREPVATARSSGSTATLVTVVVPVFQPDVGLLTAVRSLSNQTWPDLEILLVDDASGSPYQALLQRAAEVDGRVRILRQEANGGSYLARNLALTEARGEVITFHDADDWAHPERIERQLQALQADGSQVANHSLAMRAHDDLTRQWLGYSSVRTNASSIMIRTDVLRAVGGFDRVRKSGDSELAARLEALTGHNIPVLPEILAITRLRGSSLSRGDFSMGWARAARIAYQGAYRQWHRSLAGVGTDTDPELVSPVHTDPAGVVRRRFAAPRSYDPGPSARVEAFDYLLVADLCTDESGRTLVPLVRSLHDSGFSVALLHQEDPFELRRRRVHSHDAIQGVVDAGQAVQVHPEEPIEVTLVAVFSVRSLLLERDRPSCLTAQLLWVADRVPPAAATRDRLEGNLRGWCEAPVVFGEPGPRPVAGPASELLHRLLNEMAT